MISGNGKDSKNGALHPFAKKDPKPTRARLVSLLDPLGRKRYGEVERFLATIPGATSGLFYYGTQWGWAVRYLVGAKNTLCTLHLLPNTFEATIQFGKDIDDPAKAATFSPELKRRLAKSKTQAGTKAVRLPIKNDADYQSFQILIQMRAEALRTKKPAKEPAAKTKESATKTKEPAGKAKEPAAKASVKKEVAAKAPATKVGKKVSVAKVGAR